MSEMDSLKIAAKLMSPRRRHGVETASNSDWRQAA